MSPFLYGYLWGISSVLGFICGVCLLGWLLSDAVSYEIRCLTCGARSGARRFDWMTIVWSWYHVLFRSPRCAKWNKPKK